MIQEDVVEEGKPIYKMLPVEKNALSGFEPLSASKSNEIIPDEKEGKALYQESVELKKIFSSIISKSE